MNKASEIAARIRENIGKVLIGKEDIIDLVLVAMGCEGHVLMDDVPGVGKTMLARALAVSLNLSSCRIQCTPDLLPSDITGVWVFNQKDGDFSFRKGPIMHQIVLIDEINRATPRTQSSMLEAMEERQITADGHTFMLERPFLVLATQNPMEFEGTFPLPEAQLDRFLMRISLGYPRPLDELVMLKRLEKTHPIQTLKPVMEADEVQTFIQAKQTVFVEDSLQEYIVRLINKTRTHPDLALGVSPRGTLALYNAVRTLAAIQNRDYVIPGDIKKLAPFIFAHRVIVNDEAAARGINGNLIIKEILSSTEVPTEVALHG